MSRARLGDPTPITAAQVRAVLAVAGREVSWGLIEVRREIATLRGLANRIPDPVLRDHALTALQRKRTHAEGAALFATLPRQRHLGLVRLLVAYETALDFLDEVSEHHPTEENGRELHLALVDALVPERRMADYYRHHPRKADKGYLKALVERCRAMCRTLPSFGEVRDRLAREAWRTQVLGLNHVLPATERDALLRKWAREEFPDDRHHLQWFELSAAASASLVVHSLLALAAEPGITIRQAHETYSVYWPWTSLATAMLDSYVDVSEDEETSNHSYIGHYVSEGCAVARLCDCICRAASHATAARDGPRHAVIVSAMIAMYLSKDSARIPARRPATRQLLRAGGMLPRTLLPVLSLWRVAYSLRSA